MHPRAGKGEENWAGKGGNELVTALRVEIEGIFGEKGRRGDIEQILNHAYMLLRGHEFEKSE